MKSLATLQKPIAVFAVLFASCSLGRTSLADEHPKNVPLPTNCTVLAMSPVERAAHLARLETLRRAARAVTMTKDGFSFEVDLAEMRWADLNSWAESEERCCSFLKIERQAFSSGDKKFARVRVSCPADLQNEVMRSFGLRTAALNVPVRHREAADQPNASR